MARQELIAENDALKKENQLLRIKIQILEAKLEAAGLSENKYEDLSLTKAYEDLSLTKAFEAFSFKGRIPYGMKTRTFNCFHRAGYATIGEFRGKSINDLLNVRNAGVDSCALFVVVLEHYGISVAFPDINGQVRKVLGRIPLFREDCVFLK